MGLTRLWKTITGRAPAPAGPEAPALPFADAELASRFPHKPVGRFDTATGSYVLPTDADGDVIVQAIRRGETFEREIVDLAQRTIVPGSVALDVGSNFGQMAIAFSRIIGPAGKVHGFEANDFVFELLKRNLSLNGAGNVVPHFGAVWEESGKELLFPDPDFKRFASYGSYGLDLKAKEGKPVKTMKIDDLDLGGKVSFIKVDIQGSDLFAMRGAKRTILRDKPILVFEFEAQFQKEFGTRFKDYTAFIEEIGYKVRETINGINYVIGPA